MSWGGWVLFGVIEAATVLMAFFGILALYMFYREDEHEGPARAVLGYGFLGSAIVNALFLAGIIGPGWPPSVRACVELGIFIATAFLLILAVASLLDAEGDPLTSVLSATGGVILATFLVLLLTRVVWHTAGSAAASAGRGSDHGQGVLVAWTVVGSTAGVLGSVAAWVAVLRRK